MTNKLKLSASAAALALLIAGGASSVKAADVVEDPGCTLSGAVGIGYMYTWTDVSVDFDSSEDIGDKDDDSFDGNFNTPFGEAGGLVTCGAWNAQADFAYYDHSTELDDGDKDIDINASNSHFGGAVFWRDPSFASIGVHASVVGQDTEGILQTDLYRVGIFGEWYLNDQFTLGAAVHYHDGDIVDDLNQSGWEFTANARFYVTPDFSLMVQGDYITADLDGDFNFGGSTDTDFDLDGWAITGEAEYLVWDQGLSIFAGARYSERSLDFEISNANEFDKIDIDIDETQVYAGIKFYFGHDGTLIERQRTGLTDNTSTMLEKLPAPINSILSTEDDD